MDHLPLPSSASGHLKVPCMSTGLYDKAGPFESFPSRHNWKIRERRGSSERVILAPDGKTPSVGEIEAFLERWLYFGTLYEVFGELVNPLDFIANVEDGKRFLCTLNLNKVMHDFLCQSYNASDPQEMQRKALLLVCKRVHSHLQELLDIFASLRSLLEMKDSRTLFATVVLAESIGNFFRLVPIPGMYKFDRHPCKKFGYFFCEFITNHMRSLGWCPSTITRLNTGAFTYSQLYYYCHLPPPQGAQDHSSCTVDACLTLQIVPSTYHTVHTTISCECPELSIDVEKIREILDNGKVPLIEISPSTEPGDATIIVKEDDGSVGFVAISHVWADGLGNVNNNSLPACSLQEISRLVNELPKGLLQHNKLVPFWMDTVCVPVKPDNLKRLALNYLRYPYENAEHVLVFDNYLRMLNAQDCDVVEIFARLYCGNWVSRLWTLQEGQLAKRVWFQFKDKAIELKTLFRTINIEELQKEGCSPSSKGVDYFYLFIYLYIGWKATMVWNTNDLPFGFNKHVVSFLREALCSRSVSVAADEALCLFCLAGLDMKIVTLVEASVESRMKTFWSQMRSVPSGLLFLNSSQKLNELGFRWAPSTFMGKGSWSNLPIELNDNSDGIPMPQGLQAKFPGYICNVKWNELENLEEFLYFQNDGIWFRIHLELSWHAKSPYLPPNNQQDIAIILQKSLHDCEIEFSNQYSLNSIENNIYNGSAIVNVFTKGVIGCITHEGADTKYVKCLRHIVIQLMHHGEQLVLNAVDNCISSLPKVIKDQVLNMDEESFKEVAICITNAYLKNCPMISRACAKWAFSLGSLTREELFVRFLRQMIKNPITFYSSAIEALEDQRWCVD